MPRSVSSTPIKSDRGSTSFTFAVFRRETGRALVQRTLAVARHQVEIATGLTPVEPDDGQQVLLLLGGEIVNLAR